VKGGVGGGANATNGTNNNSCDINNSNSGSINTSHSSTASVRQRERFQRRTIAYGPQQASKVTEPISQP
jgi:hypothetical protein